ncbi:hypothetical protein [Hyphobacterium marinum]|uniref:Uncharacterized protein n=1 Tax=Hyphobacterium marinum TaxID=3116574 RepID=A0ABU7LY00_9PROT|nr:hypothetical protein [Hyphobacterium sp. Y6023]MEE2566065.1 hypothetical protein [Hyphobacterium sp. Y6023]
MDDDRTNQTDLTARFGRIVRGVIAAVFAIAFAGLVFFLAAVLTAAAVAVIGVALLAVGAWWLWRKIRGPKKGGSGDPTLLVARRGPDGWTVETAGRPQH